MILGVGIYFTFTRKIFNGLGKLRFTKRVGDSYRPRISVIVPARNEDHNIEETLESLAAQKYPKDKYQVVMVNDRSDDQTSGIMNRFTRNYKNFINVDIDRLSPGVSPKKNAIEWGIAAANGEIIITTDADCLHSPNWVSSMVRYFQPDVGLVAGLTIFEPDDESWAHRIHSLDYLSHSFIGAGAIGSGEGMNCTGANLAYRYETFMGLQGYGAKANMVSGDDEFFLQRVVKQGKWKAVHAIGKDTIVRSLPPETLKGIINQRHRWGSKGLYYPPKIQHLAIGIFLYFLLLILAPIFVLIDLIPLEVFLFGVAVKVWSDLMVMSRGCRIFGLKFPALIFSILSVLHPPLILANALMGHLFAFSWKGELYHSKMPDSVEGFEKVNI